MTTMGITAFIIFLLAAVIGGIYMLIYRRNINKALRENNGKHVNMPDVRNVIIFILVVVLFYGVYYTKNKMDEMYDNMEGQYQMIKDDLRVIQNNISSMANSLNELENANKQVESVEYYIVSCDEKEQTATYCFDVVLKKYTETTEVGVLVSDHYVELEGNEEGRYFGEFTVDMFKELEGSIEINIMNDDVNTIEKVKDAYFYHSWVDCLPSIWVDPVFGYEYDGDKLKLTLDEKLYITMNQDMSYYFTDVYIELDVKGEGVQKVDIGFTEDDTNYYVDLNKHFPELYPLSDMSVYVIGVDSAGFTHKVLANAWRDKSWHSYQDMGNIFDKEGNQLTDNDPMMEVYE